MSEHIVRIQDFVYRLTAESAVLKSWNKTRATVELPNFVEGLPVTDIDPEAFSGCTALRDLSLPVEIQHLPMPELKRCRTLEAIRVSPLHRDFSSQDGILYNKDKSELLDCPPARRKPVNVPETVRKIGKDAFSGCEELTKIRLPEQLEYIGEKAFSRCKKLRSLELSDSVYWIAPHALDFCTQLRTLHFSAMIENPPQLWSLRSLRAVTVAPENPFLSDYEGVLYTADRSLLLHCPKSYSGVLHLPAETGEIQREALGGCDSLTGIRVDVQNPVFADRSGVLYEKNTNRLLLCPAAYSGTLHIEADVQGIAPDAFRTQVLPAVLKENGVTKYTYIEGGPLECITAAPENPVYKTENGVLYSAGGTVLLRCPAGYRGSLTVPDGVQTIADMALCGCSELTEIHLPETLCKIGSGAFKGCFSLEKVTLPASVQSLGICAFQECMQLRHAVFENPETVIDTGCFTHCNTVILHAAKDSTAYRYADAEGLRFVEL